MYDLLAIVASMAIVVGLAAGILFVLDRLTLRRGLSREERQAIVEKRTRRWQRAWFTFYLSCAVIALVVNALNLEHESLRSRIGWSVPAAVVVILFLLSKDKDKDDDRRDESER
jgi:asparagine N-glycosylation enzyme membrane subunit Stt3